MRDCFVLAAVRTSLAALVFSLIGPAVALSATRHAAAPMTRQTPFSYDTLGVVGIGANPASVSGPAVLQFQGLTGVSYDPKAGQPIALGQFVVNPVSGTPGSATTYSGTPFEVEIHAAGLDKTSTFPVLGKLFPGLGKSLSLKTLNENSVLLKGHLDGVVAQGGQANVTATVDSVKLGSLDGPTKDHITHYTFPIRFSQLKLPPSWVMSGSSVPTGSQLGLATPIPPPAHMATASAQTLAIPAAASSAVIAPARLSQGPTPATPTPTPEPSTVVLFAAAFGGLALARRRARVA